MVRMPFVDHMRRHRCLHQVSHSAQAHLPRMAFDRKGAGRVIQFLGISSPMRFIWQPQAQVVDSGSW